MTGIWLIVTFAAGSAVACVIGTFYYRTREKRLLTHLQKMLDDARNGSCEISDISEEKLSLLENSFKRYLDESRLSKAEHREQNKMVQQLISDMAHQTLTPISNLKLYTGLLEERFGKGEMIRTVSDEAEKLDFLIQSLVKLSRMEQGIIASHPKAGSLQELLEDVQKNYAGRAEDKGLKFTVPRTAEMATFDAKWTCEAIGNIVDNAVKYTPPGGRISIDVERYLFFIRIDISDTGIGIIEEEIPKIFSRFYRSFDVADLPGVGIGLYLARYIVEQQKGYIKVTSEKGKGSVFSVFLPAVSER